MHIDKLVQLKLRHYLTKGCPPIEEIHDLQMEPLHQYKGRNIEEQRGKGINAQGEKKLIVDYAFFEDIITKLHFIAEV